MNRKLSLTFPPNVLRQVREAIMTRWPELDLGIPDVHQEMFMAASDFGQGELPALTVSAYPQIALNAMKLSAENRLAALAEDLPPLRKEFSALGLTPPVKELRLVGVVPGMLAAGAAFSGKLEDWGDMCAPDFPGPIGCPPEDTPMPYLVEKIFRGRVGDAVEQLLNKLDTSSNPIDINKRLGLGELTAALIIPAFARTFRDGPARMVWPTGGALAVPLMACLAAEAPPAAHEVLAYFLSDDFQRNVASNGVFAPVRPDIPGFEELEANRWNFFWPGWELFLDAARVMLNKRF
jgi:ABC-type Fe3+ transport system substrate-binding protein